MVNRDIRPMDDEERKRAKVKAEANQESYHNYIKRMYKEYDEMSKVADKDYEV